jgi:predicted enzyme related to lactoylglutathione lyase
VVATRVAIPGSIARSERDTREGGIGGGIGEPQDGDPTHVTFYVAVEDLQATLDKAVSLGGTVLMPIMELPMVTLAMFSDPEGHPIGIIKAGDA